MLEINKIHQGDCLELMKEIPTKSINLILCDLPYGTTACSWDEIINFKKLWIEYIRILKPSGNIVLTASQPFTSILLLSNIDWFSHTWIWQKEQGVNFLCSNNQPLKVHEDIVVFRKPNSYGVDCFVKLRTYFKRILGKINLSKKRVVEELGQGLDHCFRFNSNQWGLPTINNYEKLKNKYNLKLIPFEKLKELYDEEFYRVYNPQKTKGKRYVSGLGDSGEVTNKVQKIQTINTGTRLPITILKFNQETGLHPTQKPISLFEYLIKTYSNKGDLVLDNCAGCGTTAIASINTLRNWICIELDEKYFEIAKKRVEEHSQQSMLLPLAENSKEDGIPPTNKNV